MKTYTETKDNICKIKNEIHFCYAYGANDKLVGIIIEHFKQAKKDQVEIAVSDKEHAECEIANYLTSVEDLGKYSLFFEFKANESLFQKLKDVDHLEIIDSELEDIVTIAMMGKEHEKVIPIKLSEGSEYKEQKTRPPEQRMPDYWVSKGNYLIPVYSKIELKNKRNS